MNQEITSTANKSEQPVLPARHFPHISAPMKTRHIMLDVVISLIPSVAVAVYFYGLRALTVTLMSVLLCVVFEFLYRFWLKKPSSIGDLSAVVTGLLLALCLPAAAPYWMVAVGDFFAIIVVKQLFGGLGKNFMNPALAARAFLYSFPALTAVGSASGGWFWKGIWSSVGTASSETPMALMQSGKLPSQSLSQMLFGQHGGSMGETCAAALLLGGLYLIFRGIINLRIPSCYIATVAVLTFLFPLGGNDRLLWMTYELLGGSLLLGAFFMATDYVTSPVTRGGQVLYAIGCGGLTVLLRYFGAYPEGVYFAIILMNTAVWLLDQIRPRRFGAPRFDAWKKRLSVFRKEKGG